MKLSNWEYTKDLDGKVIITTVDNKSKPEKLIKYYSLTDYNIDAFKRNYLFFSHPLDLNDPFDSCRYMIDLRFLSKGYFITLISRYMHFFMPSRKLSIAEIINYVEHGFNNETSKMDFFQTHNPFYWNIIFSKVAVLSLSEIEDSMLLWSYYTNHKGFAVKFINLNFETTISGPYPMNYSNKYEIIYPRKVEIEIEKLIYLLTIKSEEWKHENEWRFILRKDNLAIPEYDEYDIKISNNKVTYDPKQIEYIVLGFKFFKGNITPIYISDNSRIYTFNNKSHSDKLKIDLLNLIIENKIVVRQIEAKEDNSFTLVSFPIKIEMKEKNRTYIIETQK